jgi:poly-gamma-glutamate synthase PgsB/CapB
MSPSPKSIPGKRGSSEMTIVRAAIDPLRERLAAPELEQVRKAMAERGIEGAIDVAREALDTIRTMRARFEQLSRAVEGTDEAGRHMRVEAYLRETEKGARLTQDLRALRSKKANRLLDLPALGERILGRVATEERRAEVALAVARKVSAPALDAALVDAVLYAARTEGRWSRRQEALALLADISPSLAPQSRVLVSQVARELTARAQHHWVQPAALATLAAIDPQAALVIARERLENPGPGDDLLVRERIVELASRVRREGWDDLIRLASRDPSDHVRILVARVERDLAPLATIASKDASAKVRASAILALARRHGAGAEEAYAVALEHDPDPLVVQTAADQLSFLARMHRMGTRPRTLAALHVAIERADLPLPTRNHVADVLAETTVLTNPLLRPVYDALATIVAKTPVGGGTRLMSTALGTIDDEQLGRVLAVLAKDDFPLGIDRSPGGIVLYRGEPRTFAAWRALFEIRNPTPSKRQSFIHTWSRVPRGALRAPPGGLAELTATRVPGERVLVERIGGWGRHLPLVDDLLAATRFAAKTVSIVGASGTTVVEPPTSLGRRLRSWVTLSLRYAHFVELRRRSLDSDEPATQTAYVSEVANSTAIAIRYRPHIFGAGRHRFALAPPSELAGATYPDAAPTLRELPEDPDPSSRNDGSLAFMLPPIGALLDRLGATGDLVRDLAQYSLSPQGNRLSHVAAYTLFMVGTMLFRGAAIRHGIEKDRKSVPIVIGGWGTRGKSGTERLKAGLFQGMGHEVLVKTTGCEAMFIHAVPGTPAREIFIYRPYDKATIWEQKNVLHLCSRLGARVLLWECMALQPDLVDLLQHQWMRDDYSTITNAYPDHEDVQGPAGFDVATVISAFVPTKGHLFTAEDQMLPILRERARERDTSVRVVGSAESDLISDDLLARFPYQEHPKNIALVTMLARAVGVPASVAVAEMADNVVPDLGVLKVYPTVPWAGRTLEFTNGMSANERTGAIANWRRTSFDKYEPNREPARWIVTVVNNRADRIARSEVFARFLVEDIAAHRHFLIGTNVGGLVGFIDEALTHHLETISPTANLAGTDAEKMHAAALRIDRAFARLMVVRIDAESVVAEIRALGAEPIDARLIEALLTPGEPGEPYQVGLAAVLPQIPASIDAELQPFLAQMIARRRVVRSVKAVLARDLATSPARVESAFAAAYRAMWQETVVPLHDSALTGDQIIDTIAKSVPPRAHASIMGVQNIKGTGLDFVYRWVSLDTTARALGLALSTTMADRERGMRDLSLHDDYGLVDAAFALERLKIARASDADRGTLPYDAIIARLEAIVALRGARLTSHRKVTAGERVRAFIGKTFDYMDSIRRQNMAGVVLDDLVAGRVSHAGAAIRMRDIVARAKGAWMTKRED